MQDPTSFYLSCHDYLSDPRPRACTTVGTARGIPSGTEYLHVAIDPPLARWPLNEGNGYLTHMLLSIYGERSLSDVGTTAVFVNIADGEVSAAGTINEPECRRVGVGMLHTTYEEAYRNSPMED